MAVSWVLLMSPLMVVFRRIRRVLLVAWPESVIAANDPYATGATWAGRGRDTTDVRSAHGDNGAADGGAHGRWRHHM